MAVQKKVFPQKGFLKGFPKRVAKRVPKKDSNTFYFVIVETFQVTTGDGQTDGRTGRDWTGLDGTDGTGRDGRDRTGQDGTDGTGRDGRDRTGRDRNHNTRSDRIITK